MTWFFFFLVVRGIVSVIYKFLFDKLSNIILLFYSLKVLVWMSVFFVEWLYRGFIYFLKYSYYLPIRSWCGCSITPSSDDFWALLSECLTWYLFFSIISFYLLNSVPRQYLYFFRSKEYHKFFLSINFTDRGAYLNFPSLCDFSFFLSHLPYRRP